MKYVLGIDQGGSKTHAIVSDEYGNVLGMGKSYGACHSSDGLEYAIAAVSEAAEQALRQGGISIQEIEVIAAGMTGVDWDFEEKLLTDALGEVFSVGKIEVVNDCIIAMRAGTKSNYGCVLCAGSGLNCAVRNESGDQIIYGFYIDEEFQGGVSLGKLTVKAVIDSHIGLKPETKLTQMLLNYFKVGAVEELLYKKVTGGITSRDYLHLPLILEEAAAQNDAVALSLFEYYGKNIAMYVVRGMEKLSMLNMRVDVILSGSIFKCRVPILREAVSLEIHKYAIHANIVDAHYEPIVGAALLGLDCLHKETPPEVYKNLEKSAEKFQIRRIEDISVKLGAKLCIKSPETIICEDFEAMSQYSADLICKALKDKPDSLLCLPAGSSAVRTFQILKERFDAGEVDFSKAYFVALDEWLDLEDDAENCTSFMLENFYHPLNIDKNRIRLFNVHAQDLEEECKSVDNFIFEHGKIDLMLLGLGMNGHLGLNEPGESFDSYAKVVTLDAVTQKIGQKYFSKPMKLTRGITLGMRHIFETKQVVLQVGGKAKADIVKKVYRSKPSVELPATVMQLVKNGVVVLDRDAAAEIESL